MLSRLVNSESCVVISFTKTFTIIAFYLSFVINGRAQNPDIDLLRKINNSDMSSGTYRSFHFITNSTLQISLSVPIGLLATGFIEDNRQMKLKAAYMLESIAVSEGITFASKYAFNRTRPFVAYPFIVQKAPGNSPSFPSGHTSLAFCMATSLSMAYPRWYIVAPSLVYASAVGYSRMYLGVHYPSDVVAGAVVGAGSAILSCKINRWLHRSRYKRLSVSW